VEIAADDQAFQLVLHQRGQRMAAQQFDGCRGLSGHVLFIALQCCRPKIAAFGLCRLSTIFMSEF
jgi:hypothetical protein